MNPRIAVYELKARGVSENTAAILSEVRRDKIFHNSSYDMLTGADMQLMLNDLAKDRDIKPQCETDACLSEIAAALGVERMITGSVGKIGDMKAVEPLIRLQDDIEPDVRASAKKALQIIHEKK